ncbi:MAG: hypothetical protein HRT88_12050 [Lentisphaeraceae bacterium]|nr:hypothetical protein [Lentisphaeraceae bacterium]
MSIDKKKTVAFVSQFTGVLGICIAVIILSMLAPNMAHISVPMKVLLVLSILTFLKGKPLLYGPFLWYRELRRMFAPTLQGQTKNNLAKHNLIKEESSPENKRSLNQKNNITDKVKWYPLTDDSDTAPKHKFKKASLKRVEFITNASTLRNVKILKIILIAVFVRIMFLENMGVQVKAFLTLIFSSMYYISDQTIFKGWRTPRIFDFTCGYYWKGKKLSAKATSDKCPLSEIHALQLIKKRCVNPSDRVRKEVLYKYELNLVLQDASRINVTDHNNESLMRLDLRDLAEFLNVPILDGTFR